MIGIELN
ncbi:hypothetical protein KM1_258290, partial [Entamoeba histolytica HM-3:IMSS]